MKAGVGPQIKYRLNSDKALGLIERKWREKGRDAPYLTAV